MNRIRLIILEYKGLIATFILFIIVSFSYFHYNKNVHIKELTSSLQAQYSTQYKITYDNFKQLSQNTFYGIINKSNIYSNLKDAYKKDDKTQKYYRDKLHSVFLSDYNRLLHYKFKQLHFHFKDNSSFLRMHKPSKYGDDLSTIRYSVEKANKTLKPVDGFEIGRVLHGFRFVYPLHDLNLFHIGSVEVSMSADMFEDSFESNYGVDVHFLINKKIAKEKMFKEEFLKLSNSVENKQFAINESKRDEQVHYVHNTFYTDKELQIIEEKMSLSEYFVITKSDNGKYFNIFFKPISSVKGIKNSAYLVIYSKSDYLKQVYSNYYRMIFILILLIIIFGFYLNIMYLKKRKEHHKELMMTQQSKMASMGEMIGNIAHQWRQPLSVISTASSGMLIQKEYGMLTDDMFKSNIESILKNVDYLSNTIEDFRNYFRKDKEKKSFLLEDMINNSLSIFGNSFSENNILVITNIEEISIVSYESLLKQVIINLLKNAKDVIEKDGFIIVDVVKTKNQVIITIQDSGGGIPAEILPKIFEPYFTTKHQSQGTGLGLYMSYEIVSKTLKGKFSVENKQFDYNFTSYMGACFTVILDINNL